MTTPPVRRDVWENRHQPHVVYEFYDQDGEPVYVGFTSDLIQRLQTHRASAMWREVTEIHTQTYPDRRAAQDEEARLIRQLQPRWNFQHTDRASDAARERHRRRREALGAES